ncbi:MAG: hypothetical protein V3R94_09920 [Acidobacteriota bacterium]
MLQGVEPISTYFFVFAWWTYIVFLSGINHLRGKNSLLLDHPREFLWVFLFSTPVWLFFEIYNFRLNNWEYVGVPIETLLRWPGYLISFGTVLPGLFETETFLKNLGIAREVRGRPIQVTRRLVNRLTLAGLLMMLMPLWLPSFFFPLIWLGGIFLLDPVLYRQDQQNTSLLGQAQQGNYALTVRLLLAGVVCGGLWEFWNFWASAKWIYTLPYLEFLKVFEMPVLGFLGFPPFGLECYLCYRCFLLCRTRCRKDRRLVAALVLIGVCLYCLLTFVGIDRFTIASYKVTFL